MFTCFECEFLLRSTTLIHSQNEKDHLLVLTDSMQCNAQFSEKAINKTATEVKRMKEKSHSKICNVLLMQTVGTMHQ